ncbi:SecDF P1 head subdomain-containing protein [Nocardiopsis alba]|uniref:SecDF P1 head subdomain-containing protein n=1 Tax=Nocardiopsis alba TaxID=53437 RepID=UPI003D74D10B
MTLPDQDSPVQLQLGPVRLGSDEIESAEAEFDASGSEWVAHVEFTGEVACYSPGIHPRRIAIVVDEEVVSAPEAVPDAICAVGVDDVGMDVTGVFTEVEALTLVALISADPLPVEVTAES